MKEKIFIGNVKNVDTQYGQIIKLGIREADLPILQNHLTNGWVNVAIRQGKSGKWYAEIDLYKRQQQQAQPQETETDEDNIVIPGEIEDLF